MHVIPTADASVINFSWLVRLRWGAVTGQLVTVLVVDRIMHIHLPMPPLLAIISFAALSNAACALWVRHQDRVGEAAATAILVLDVLLLTALLSLTGGPFNPFSFLYLVHIALAAVVLSERATWGLVVLSLTCFGSLFLLPVQGPVDHSDPHMHGEHLRMHLEGMWVAFGVAAGFIVYFVQRVTRALAVREQELSQARAVQERSEKFASLVTLAAGAAHELATPLSTIAVVSKELERMLEVECAGAAVDDARLIRGEVERCRKILSQMTAAAGESMGEAARPTRLGDLIDSAVRSSAQPARVDVEGDAAADFDGSLCLPREAVARAIANAINNALQASPEESRVTVRVARAAGFVQIAVRDRGSGMSADVRRRVGEPFFTTKPPGQGMGLGIFLARAVLTRLGGAVEFASEQGRGTTVTLLLPESLANPRQAGREPERQP